MYTMYKDNCDYNQSSTGIKPALKNDGLYEFNASF